MHSAADLVVTSDSGSSPDLVALSGTGVLGPIISLSGDPVVFPATRAGTVSHDTLTASNTGGTPLHVSSVSLSGAGAQFKLVGTGCQGAVVGPGAGCSVAVEFAPTSAGAHSAILELDSDAQGSPTVVAVRGTGRATTARDPNRFSFVSVKAGRRGAITVKLELPRAGHFSLSTSWGFPRRRNRRAKTRQIAYSRRVAARIHGPTTATIRITPNREAAAALKSQGRLRVAVSVRFAPTGFRARTARSAVTVRAQ